MPKSTILLPVTHKSEEEIIKKIGHLIEDLKQIAYSRENTDLVDAINNSSISAIQGKGYNDEDYSR